MSEREQKGPIAGLITKLQQSGEFDREKFTDSIVHFMLSGAQQKGFWSGEIIPPGHLHDTAWTLVQRFNTVDDAENWKQSPRRQQLLDEVMDGANGQMSVVDELSERGSPGTVATAIVSDVKAGMEVAHWEWVEKIHAAQARFTGYAGVYLQPPPVGTPGQWITVLRFDSPETLDAWFVSGIRKKLLDQASSFITRTRVHALNSSFPGWFPQDEGTNAPPPKWKTAMLVLLGLYPMVMLLRRFFFPLLGFLPTAPASAVNTVASVCMVTYVTMPALIKTFGWWLTPGENAGWKVDLKGAVLGLLILCGEIILFWDLFPNGTR